MLLDAKTIETIKISIERDIDDLTRNYEPENISSTYLKDLVQAYKELEKYADSNNYTFINELKRYFVED